MTSTRCVTTNEVAPTRTWRELVTGHWVLVTLMTVGSAGCAPSIPPQPSLVLPATARLHPVGIRCLRMLRMCACACKSRPACLPCALVFRPPMMRGRRVGCSAQPTTPHVLSRACGSRPFLHATGQPSSTASHVTSCRRPLMSVVGLTTSLRSSAVCGPPSRRWRQEAAGCTCVRARACRWRRLRAAHSMSYEKAG